MYVCRHKTRDDLDAGSLTELDDRESTGKGRQWHNAAANRRQSEVKRLAASREFVEFVLELMLGGASARRMFGGVGIYHDGVMFALIADDVLYFKVTPSNNHEYDAEGLGSFTYKTAGGQRTLMSYRRAPACCMDDRDSMAEWSQKAWTAACEKPKRRQPRRNV